MNINEILTSTGLPVAYGRFGKKIDPPFLIYMGAGQYNFDADNTHYNSHERYRVEYYFKIKSQAAEAAIEKVLLDNGLLYEKSEDIYLDDEDIFAVYYYIN